MGELIGRKIEVLKSVRKELVGLKGTVVDETLNLFTVDVQGKEKKIPKGLCVFRISIDDAYRDVDGRDIEYRPEDRIKKYWRKFDGAMRRQKLS